MVTFYDYPKQHWRHLRTTTPVESPFATLRIRTDAARRYKKADRGYSGHMEDADGGREQVPAPACPGPMADVYLGAKYKDGVAIEATVERIAA